MSSIRIYPLHDPDTVADFLSRHGFNLGPLTNEGFFVSTLHEVPGAIDTMSYLKRLESTAKVDPRFEFRIEGAAT